MRSPNVEIDVEKIKFEKSSKELFELIEQYNSTADESIYPMIGWYEKLGNIHADNLRDIFYNNKLLNEARKHKASDFAECVNCAANDYCVFCPSAHITANHGELGKLDVTFCDYVRLVKKFAERRDEISGGTNLK